MTGDARALWERDGVLHPIRVLDADEAALVRDSCERQCGPDGLRGRSDNAHLRHRWAWDLALHPRVLDAVESILGPDFVVHSTRLIVKAARDPAYVSWHQDGVYTALNDVPCVTAWIALSDSTRENGCVRVVPGTHRGPVLRHRRVARGNDSDALNNGEIDGTDVDERDVRDVVLLAGEMSVHHVNLVHGSRPNRSDAARLGFNISYCTPAVTAAPAPVVVARGSNRCEHLPRMDAFGGECP
jgi:non-haem Fe2+, alpha-ketoglutarate-dependent halogenase